LVANHVALVDDVITTGSTLSELARVLKRHGVKRVDAWAVARTP
ncbi:MAG: phosphoribosyltransferase family protein, partial [Sedimenticola sp.]